MRQSLPFIIILVFISMAYSNCSSQEAGVLATSQARSLTCAAPPGVSASPQTIEQAVALMNALPLPTSVPCFIQSLERPLAIYATYSTASAQPALGVNSPRIFIFKGPLVMSVVPDGIGKNLIEFGEIKSYGQTLKAEVKFPLYQDLDGATPFDRIESGGITTCTGCHSSEYRDTSITYAKAYVSKALRPFATFKVSTANLRAERVNCGADTGYRCELLRTLFDYGDVQDTEFPSQIP